MGHTDHWHRVVVRPTVEEGGWDASMCNTILIEVCAVTMWYDDLCHALRIVFPAVGIVISNKRGMACEVQYKLSLFLDRMLYWLYLLSIWNTRYSHYSALKSLSLSVKDVWMEVYRFLSRKNICMHAGLLSVWSLCSLFCVWAKWFQWNDTHIKSYIIFILCLNCVLLNSYRHG